MKPFLVIALFISLHVSNAQDSGCPPITFNYGSHLFTADSQQATDCLLNMMKQNPGWQLELKGHRCFREKKHQQDSLSLKRVKSIFQFLVANNIEQDRVLIVDKGATQNIITSKAKRKVKTDQKLSVNRRVDATFVNKGFVSQYRKFWVQCVAVKDKGTGKPLAGVKVEMIASDGKSIQVMTNENGAYIVELKPEMNYEFTFCKHHYYTETRKLSTRRLKYSDTLDLCVEMDDVKPRCGPAPGIDFDAYSFELSAKYKKDLEYFLPVLTTNPTLVIELSSHCDYTEAKKGIKYDSLRGAAVKNYWVSKGIDANRLVIRHYSNLKPRTVPYKPEGQWGLEYWNKDWGEPYEAGIKLDRKWIDKNFKINGTEWKAAMKKNRRVEMSVLRNDYVPPEGLPKSDTGCQ